MATEHFTIMQGGRRVGEGSINTESGYGKMNLHGLVFYFEAYRAYSTVPHESEGNHERLPDQRD